MSDDLVARLRKEKSGIDILSANECHAVADEIKRLRADLAELARIAELEAEVDSLRRALKGGDA